jgi:integrase
MPKHRESPVARVNPSGKKVWVARYTDPDGRRRSAGTFKTKREAQDTIDDAYGRPPARETVGQYARDWTARYPRSERTDKTNRGRVAAVLEVKVEGRALKNWPFAELRRRHALELVDRMLRDQGRAATGAANILRTLSAMAEDAITDELIGTNPFKGTRVRRSDPRASRPSRRPRVLSWAQMHDFAAAAGRHEPMVRMLGDCGLRVGELFALLRELQDLRDGVFEVRGSAWEGVVVESSETKEHDRSGPIPPDCLALLRDMPQRIDSPWLFPTPTGRTWRINNFYRDVWRPARRVSGLECTPQDFRHSYVSNLSAAGIDVADLADISGHSVETAQQRYRHALRRSFEQVRETIG